MFLSLLSFLEEIKKLKLSPGLYSLFRRLIPLDFTFIDLNGPPKIVHYVMGFPTEEAFTAAERGELVLGSCMVSGFEPKKVVVW
ncbi:hypothetical protein AltI4_25150 [Alteromonas sp. I4]|nr:hypothetical protein [Alteromonadaceae bacterium]BBO28127.1 hypothetical protein AltI4_25150 [Alteromonas sp. I4]